MCGGGGKALVSEEVTSLAWVRQGVQQEVQQEVKGARDTV